MDASGEVAPRTWGRRHRATAIAGVVALLLLGAAPASQAVHFYRGPVGGCTPASGALSDDPGASGPLGATVRVLHNTFNDATTGLPVTRIEAGQSVRWDWSSAHCHSVQAPGKAFYSGYHHPTTAPDSPRAVPGFFDYPVPELDPTLSYQRTFTTPGTYTYMCEHHAAIGMVGTIVVE